jgi:hypothetical protein
MLALNPHLTKFRIHCTLSSEDHISSSEEQGNANCPFKIKPDCSVFAEGYSFGGTDSSATKLFIEFKWCDEYDPFFMELPQPRMSSSDNTTPPTFQSIHENFCPWSQNSWPNYILCDLANECAVLDPCILSSHLRRVCVTLSVGT